MRTQRLATCCVLGAGIVWGAACAEQAAVEPYRPVATVQQIMDGIVDPSADVLFESVATISTAAGIEERQPRTDEEWAAVRARAITLLESANLLMMSRKVGEPGEPTVEGVELPPDQIEARIGADRTSWNTLALGLQTAVQPALDAIARRDPLALQNAGETIDTACENCHLKYWYPNQPKPPS